MAVFKILISTSLWRIAGTGHLLQPQAFFGMCLYQGIHGIGNRWCHDKKNPFSKGFLNTLPFFAANVNGRILCGMTKKALDKKAPFSLLPKVLLPP